MQKRPFHVYTSHNVVPPKIAFPIQISKAIISEAPLPPNYLRRSHPPFLESGHPWEPTFPSFLGVIYHAYIILGVQVAFIFHRFGVQGKLLYDFQNPKTWTLQAFSEEIPWSNRTTMWIRGYGFSVFRFGEISSRCNTLPIYGIIFSSSPAPPKMNSCYICILYTPWRIHWIGIYIHEWLIVIANILCYIDLIWLIWRLHINHSWRVNEPIPWILWVVVGEDRTELVHRTSW